MFVSKQVTVIDDDNLKNLRTKQCTEIKKSLKSVSLSRIINDAIRNCK